MGEIEKLPARSEIAEADKWALEDLFLTDADWEAAVKQLEEQLAQLKGYAGKVSASADALYAYLTLADETENLFEKVLVYSNEKMHEDMGNFTYQGYAAQAQAAATHLSAAEAFFEPELLAMEESRLQGFFKEDPKLEKYRLLIDRIWRRKEHTLSAAEEEILAKTYEMATAPDDIFSMFNDADAKFGTIRDENGKEIRKAFIPDEGALFFSADYSQIELRIMAHLSEDKNMIDAFLSGYDIHAATAAKVYKTDIKEVNPDMRRKAKTANFGIIYGISVFGLAERMNVDRKEAKELIDGYFETYPQVKAYMDKSIEIAREKGYVETIFHRKRFLPDINSRNAVVRGYAERNAINAPIQGSAADIIKVAMARIYERFKREGLKAKMILQVHDELNFSVPVEEKERVEQVVIEEMEKAYRMHVPLKADCGWGKNWLEAH